jgi:hypothetical protein
VVDAHVRKDPAMGQYQARVAASLWAAALIVSFNSSADWLPDLSQGWSTLVASIVALALLARPDSIRLLQLSILSYCVSAFVIMPAIPNHRMVLLFAGLSLLPGTVRSSLSAKSIANLRWLTLCVYCFAVLAKLNHDYLASDPSCASLFLTESLQLHGLLSMHSDTHSPGVSIAGWWSLISEGLLVVLLLPLRSRGAGVFLGIGFHLLLATHYIKYFANFSAAMFLLLCSWLSESQCRWLWTKYLQRKNSVLLVGALALYLALLAHAAGLIGAAAWVLLRYALWSGFGWLLLIAVWKAVRYGESEQEGRSSLRLATSRLLVIAALVNGLSPYLGIKTRSSFSMYSNLRIEPAYSNHLFMPGSADLFGFLSDTVRVTASTDERLSRLTPTPNERIPYLSLCAHLAAMDDGPPDLKATVSYERGGSQLQAERGERLPEDCPNWIARKLLLFGSVGEGAERQCVW